MSLLDSAPVLQASPASWQQIAEFGCVNNDLCFYFDSFVVFKVEEFDCVRFFCESPMSCCTTSDFVEIGLSRNRMESC